MFPLERATEIALNETKKFLETDRDLKRVVFVCFGDKVLKVYQDLYRKIFTG
jgi:O-acetyl-ADP-ribose deacetylase (regulator of RNase III)